MTGLTYLDKLALYTPGPDNSGGRAAADNYVETLRAMMLDPAVYGLTVSAHLSTAQGRIGRCNDFMLQNGFTKRFVYGGYEGGWAGGFAYAAGLTTSVQWPDERATAWSSANVDYVADFDVNGNPVPTTYSGTTTYSQGAYVMYNAAIYVCIASAGAFNVTPGTPAAAGIWRSATNVSFVTRAIGGTTYLCRCLAPHTSGAAGGPTDPAVDINMATGLGTYWGLIPKCSSGLQRVVELQTRILRDPTFYDWMKALLDGLRTTFPSGVYFSYFNSSDDMPTSPGATWGAREATDYTSGPKARAWEALVAANAEWQAAAAALG
jgi:hypothetical protein